MTFEDAEDWIGQRFAVRGSRAFRLFSKKHKILCVEIYVRLDSGRDSRCESFIFKKSFIAALPLL